MGTSRQNDWQNLAKLSQQGDQQAYAALLTDLVPYIRSVLLGGLARPEDADDITQDVLISIHKSLKTYDASQPFLPWLHAVIKFRKIDYLRRHYARQGDKMVTDDVLEFSPEMVTFGDKAGEYKDIEAAMDQLSDQQRRIFEMIKIKGYSAKEVANEMDMNETAVKVAAHRAMKKLQDLLK